MGDILKGRVAIVTGSGQGIGRALAMAFAAEGAKVVTNNRKKGSTGSQMITDEEYERLSDEKKKWYLEHINDVNGDAETTAQAIRLAGGEASAFFADISKFDQAEALVEFAVKTYGKIDIVANIAGSFGFSDIDKISEELWDRVTSVKPKGYFNVMRFAIPYMKKQHYGRIINCSSRAFMGDVIKHAEYCAANAGVVGLTRAAAIELWEYGITCNAFSPFARTRAAYELEAVNMTRETSIMIGSAKAPPTEITPMPELMTPFLTYLASEASAEISGSMFSLAGNSISLHAEPVVCRNMFKAGSEPWTFDEIAKSAPRSIFAGYRSIAKPED